MPSAASLATSEAVAQFQRDGFVVTPGALSGDHVARYGAIVDRIVAARTAGDTRPVGDKTTYEQSFVQCMRLWETDADIRPLVFDVRLAATAAALLDAPKVLLWQDQALYKETGGRETTAHQDLPFWPLGDAPLISAWIPFDDVSADAGAMAYVPGSHRAGPLKVVDITHQSAPYDILSDPALGGARPRTVLPRAGDIVWHHGLTVHQAAANTTGRTRRAFTIVYIAAGARRAKSWPTFPLDRAGIGVGDEVAGEGLPVAWPREAGDYPEPPAHVGAPTGPQVRVR